jgi:hypothetical protein
VNNNLYLIVPFFNFNKSKAAEESLQFFLNQKFEEDTKIIVVQGLMDEQQPLQITDIYKHLTVKIPHKLWLQNNLINYGINHLPSDWKYVAWCDRDIVFCDHLWSKKVIQKLNEVDILQPFSNCFHLSETGAVDLQEQKELFKPGFGEKNGYAITSFCKHFCLHGPEIDYDIFRHTGHIWAANRTFFEKTGGKLFDKAFLGAADIILSSSIKQIKNEFYESIFINEYLDYYSFFQKKDTKVGYCDGVILHRNHGSIKTRMYNQRYAPFIQDPYFDINIDISYNQDGILQISERGQRFSKYIDWYFSSRN